MRNKKADRKRAGYGRGLKLDSLQRADESYSYSSSDDPVSPREQDGESRRETERKKADTRDACVRAREDADVPRALRSGSKYAPRAYFPPPDPRNQVERCFRCLHVRAGRAEIARRGFTSEEWARRCLTRRDQRRFNQIQRNAMIRRIARARVRTRVTMRHVACPFGENLMKASLRNIRIARAFAPAWVLRHR
jgi:hypothetical protein